MSITESDWDLHKAGSRDSARHQEKLTDAFRKQLKDLISQEDIITSQKGKTVKVPIRSLDTWHFIFDKKKQKQVGQGDGDSKVGDILQSDKESQEGQEQAGSEPGVEYYEAEIELSELIEMMLEDLSLPRLDPKKSYELRAKDTKYNDLRKKGVFSNLDKKKTLIQNIKRNAQSGEAKIDGISQDDLRFRTWNEEWKPVTSAVVIACMDVSGSMTETKKYLARSFFFWMVNFLRHKYQEVEVVFISHTTEARICTEHEFFYQGESGGTMCSSAYALALDVIDKQYDPNDWNIFTFHFSDGDTWSDEDKCVEYIQELAKVCNMVGYGEINPNGIDTESLQQSFGMGYTWPSSPLSKVYSQKVKEKNFVSGRISKKEDVWGILKRFFSEEINAE